MTKNYTKPILLVLGLIAILMLTVLFFTSGKLMTFIMLFPWVIGKVQQITGFDIWVSRSLAAAISLALLIVIPMAISWRKTKRERGLYIVTCSIIIICLGMFWMEKDYNFTPDGNAKRYVAQTPWGDYEEIPSNYSIHPIYGTQATPITPAIALKMQLKNKGLPEFQHIPISKNLRLFAQDGTPLVWYYQHPDGKIELFANAGMHPILNVTLAPINSTVASQLLDYLQNEPKMIKANISGHENNSLADLHNTLTTLRK